MAESFRNLQKSSPVGGKRLNEAVLVRGRVLFLHAFDPSIVECGMGIGGRGQDIGKHF